MLRHLTHTNPFSGLFLILVLTTVLSTTVLAQESESASDFGYVEGRIVALDLTSKAAHVHLASDAVVNAALPHSDMEDSDSFALPAFQVGQHVELYYVRSADGILTYTVVDWIHRPALLWLVGLFLLVAVGVARWKGLRAFVATAASFGVVVGVLVPGLIGGWPPVLVALLGASGILIFTVFFVHGVNWAATASVIGTLAAVGVTLGLGVVFSRLAHITGLGSEETAMLAFQGLPLEGLLLAGLVIGALGALTDITIVQASTVRELAHAQPDLSFRSLYGHGMNVGRDHVGSLIDTLVLAYTGAALPLLVLLTLSDLPFHQALNLELVAMEIIHILVGATGLVLAVPLTTALAAFMFRGDRLSLTRRTT